MAYPQQTVLPVALAAQKVSGTALEGNLSNVALAVLGLLPSRWPPEWLAQLASLKGSKL